jgi:hypothetical protein
MNAAIEIVQAMYDEAMAYYSSMPSHFMAERIDTLEDVLRALTKAREQK